MYFKNPIENICKDPVTAMAIAAVVGTGASLYQGQKAGIDAKKARDATKGRATKELDRQKTELAKTARQRRSSQTRRDSLLRGGIAKGGSPTQFTGAGGIDPSVLSLARNTLLG